MNKKSFTLKQLAAAGLFSLSTLLPSVTMASNDDLFQRIAVFPVCENSDCFDSNIETVAEIVAASKNGKTLVYTDSEQERLGFVDISSPKQPLPAGFVDLGGEPTSVAVRGRFALVVVNTSADFINTSGKLMVININTRAVEAELLLAGQPDAIAVSPDGRYAAIAIENERDEDLGDGEPPQAPAGFLQIVDLVGKPSNWGLRAVSFDNVPTLFPLDAEPEYVDINQHNIAAVTLQENNHIILVRLSNGKIINDFSAGTVDLEKVDATEEDPALISLTESLSSVAREPDGITWLSNNRIATADEGDLFGGSRGFTIFDKHGNVRFDAGNSLDHMTVRFGHYPDDRSGNKGNEPENVEFAKFGNDNLLFVGSERSSVIFVYELKGHNAKPEFIQVLPAGVGPEGLLAIPQRNLFVAASEVDDRGDKIRSVINIYRRNTDKSKYPRIQSADRADGTPIPWSALSGLAADAYDRKTVYTIHDSFYQQSRIFKMDVKQRPAVITDEIILNDNLNVLAAVEPVLVNADKTVNLDQEGIAVADNGDFWIASEGDDAPVFFRNLLVRVAANGTIQQAVTLPASVTARMIRFGFEGVASVGSGHNEVLYVAFQREWTGDTAGHVRIGRYEVATGDWTFFYYPLEAATSPNGGWVGLSELTYLGNDEFAVIERDNQAGLDATIKRIYKFSVAGLTPLADAQTPAFPVVSKTIVSDLLPHLKATGGLVLEKIEGMAVLRNGKTLIVNDNDGVDDSNGETQLLRLRNLF